MPDIPVTLFNALTGQCDCGCDCACAVALPATWLPTLGHIAPAMPVETPLVLSAWLHITDCCNLRCDYCYTAHTAADMSPAIGRAAIDAIFRSAVAHGYRAVKLKYAGGEPLLRFPLVLELHRYAHAQAARHGIALLGIVLSNGTLLTPAMVDAMQAVGLRLMISLDGIGAMHDCQRHYADGRGSFVEVARAIDLALADGLAPEISVTVSGRNAPGLAETVGWILERNLPFSLNFYREHGRSDCQSDLRLDNARIIEGMLAAYKVIEGSLPNRSLLGSLADRANLSGPHLRTCSAGQSYLAFDTQGRVAKCQMDMAYPVTDCDDPDPLATCRASNIGLCNPIVDAKDACRNCEWRYVCGGGCPLQVHRIAGHYDAKSPYCAIYQALLPEVVRLETLRLRKWM
ncbi:MAG: radical SAM protein [Anaerolineae bacterium]|nr:radical SAM protein [Anaerolineae bacterium]